jgi:hypothetical protein
MKERKQSKPAPAQNGTAPGNDAFVFVREIVIFSGIDS